MPEWMQIVRDFGLPTGLVIYLMWRDYQRDQRANQKEDETAAAFKALNEKQFELIGKCIEAVTTSNELKRDLKHAIELIWERVEPDKHAQTVQRKTGGHAILGGNES